MASAIIQDAKRTAREYTFEHFKAMVYLITGGLDFTKVNPAC
jgi:hypothetical protein